MMSMWLVDKTGRISSNVRIDIQLHHTRVSDYLTGGRGGGGVLKGSLLANVWHSSDKYQLRIESVDDYGWNKIVKESVGNFQALGGSITERSATRWDAIFFYLHHYKDVTGHWKYSIQLADLTGLTRYTICWKIVDYRSLIPLPYTLHNIFYFILYFGYQHRLKKKRGLNIVRLFHRSITARTWPTILYCIMYSPHNMYTHSVYGLASSSSSSSSAEVYSNTAAK